MGVRLPESTEWLLHSVATLAMLEPGSTASAAQLAEYYDVPPAYLAKQLQTLVRAGVLVAATGPRGGFRLARPATEITLLDVVEAVDGSAPPYQCNEIRQRGLGASPPEQCRQMCGIAARMAAAHAAWRASLRDVTITDVLGTVPRSAERKAQRLLAR